MMHPGGSDRPTPLDVSAVSASVLVKLGSIARHVEEATSENGHVFDIEAARTLLADPEVQEWMKWMDEMALLPVLR